MSLDPKARRDGFVVKYVGARKFAEIRIPKGTPLSETLALMSEAGIDDDSIVALAGVTIAKARRLDGPVEDIAAFAKRRPTIEALRRRASIPVWAPAEKAIVPGIGPWRSTSTPVLGGRFWR
jgi:hypothetical protein